MRVHHTKAKQALELGCYVQIGEDKRIRIFWPNRSVELFSSTVNEALQEMQSVQSILKMEPDYKIVTNGRDCNVMVVDQTTNKLLVGSPALPSTLMSILEAAEDEWVEANGWAEPKLSDADRINGIPTSGKLAYKEGVPAADCPHAEGTPEFDKWNDEWDAAADAEVIEPVKLDNKVGSVVTNRYRALYSERGHPTHCGDALANLLNSICVNKAGTNLELFERICAANQVSLTKYDRSAKGWQGRLRMTGRNLLAKRVLENGGKLLMPDGLGQEYYQLDDDWKNTTAQKYKPKG